MSELERAIGDLVIANRILANELLPSSIATTRPDAPEVWRAWEYWAVRAGCADMLARTKPRAKPAG
jgi:hypothetical protein